MKVIGIVGGMGVGKTSIVSLFQQLHNTHVISGDEIGHKILRKDGRAYYSVIDAFGPLILDSSHEISRKKLGEIVFHDSTKLSLLNRLTHPIIYDEVKREIESLKSTNEYDFIIVDAALLFEIGLDKLTDIIVGVYAEDSIRIKRIMERDLFTEEEAKRRIKVQKRWEEYNKTPDYFIDNSFSIDFTKDQLARIISEL